MVFATPTIFEELRAFPSASLAQLHRDGFREKAWSAESFRAMLALSTTFGEVLVVGNDTAGFYLAQHAAETGELLTFMVATPFRGLRYGHLLLQKFLSLSAKKGLARLFLDVWEGNHAAVSLYQKMGFRAVGKRPAYYGQEGNICKDSLTFYLPIYEKREVSAKMI